MLATENAVSTKGVREAIERTCAHEEHAGQVDRHVHAEKNHQSLYTFDVFLWTH